MDITLNVQTFFYLQKLNTNRILKHTRTLCIYDDDNDDDEKRDRMLHLIIML